MGMGMGVGIGKPKYFTRIFAALSAVALIYTLAISCVFYFGNRNALLSQYEGNMNFLLRQERERLDTQLEAAFSLTRQVMNNEYMAEFATAEGTASYPYAVYKIREAIDKSSQTFTSYGYFVEAVSMKTRAVVAAGSSKTLDQAYRELGVDGGQRQMIEAYMSNPEKRAPDIVFQSRVSGAALIGEQDANCVVILTRSSTPAYPIAFFIILDKKMLTPDIGGETANFWGILHGGELVAATPNAPEGIGQAAAGLDKSMEYQTVAESRALDSRIAVIRSRHGGWHYFVGMANSVIGGTLRRQLLASGLVYLLIMAASLLLAFWLAGKVYRPIAGIVRAVGQHSAAPRGANDIEYIHSSFIDLEEANKRLKAMVEQNTAEQARAVPAADGLPGMRRENFYYPLEMEHDLIISVIRADRAKAEHILGGIMARNFGKGPSGGHSAPHLAVALLNTIDRITIQAGRECSPLLPDRDALHSELRATTDAALFEKRICGLFSQLMDSMALSRSQSEKDLGKTMLDYVHRHYAEDIALTDVAQILNVSPGYVSALFKSVTGENFRDCLNRYRVEKSKEIMSKKRVQIKDVASMVGYNSPNAFIRIFNKYEGISPGQHYKKNNSGKEIG
jgi:AraC-like DNA-binding protein